MYVLFMNLFVVYELMTWILAVLLYMYVHVVLNLLL